jgi:hypothetical protein
MKTFVFHFHSTVDNSSRSKQNVGDSSVNPTIIVSRKTKKRSQPCFILFVIIAFRLLNKYTIKKHTHDLAY